MQRYISTILIWSIFVLSAVAIGQRACINELREQVTETPISEQGKLILSPDVTQLQETELRDAIQLCHAELTRTRGDVKDRERDLETVIDRLYALQERLRRIAAIASEE